MVVVLLGHAEVGLTYKVPVNRPCSPCSMQSYYRLKWNDCGGGNLLKIHLNQSNNAKLDGRKTTEHKTSKCCCGCPRSSHFPKFRREVKDDRCYLQESLYSQDNNLVRITKEDDRGITRMKTWTTRITLVIQTWRFQPFCAETWQHERLPSSWWPPLTYYCTIVVTVAIRLPSAWTQVTN